MGRQQPNHRVSLSLKSEQQLASREAHKGYPPPTTIYGSNYSITPGEHKTKGNLVMDGEIISVLSRAKKNTSKDKQKNSKHLNFGFNGETSMTMIQTK